MARYFAEIKNDIVQRVIVADTKEWCIQNLGGEWIETFPDGVKQYAGKGHTYNRTKGSFIPEKPYPSFVLNEEDRWEAPVPRPKDKDVVWNEDAGNWEDQPLEAKMDIANTETI